MAKVLMSHALRLQVDDEGYSDHRCCSTVAHTREELCISTSALRLNLNVRCGAGMGGRTC